MGEGCNSTTQQYRTWSRGGVDVVESAINLHDFPDPLDDYYNFSTENNANKIDELEVERRLINDTVYNSNTKYDKTSDTAQTRSFKIHNKSINVVIGILFSILIILVIYLVIKLFGLLK